MRRWSPFIVLFAASCWPYLPEPYSSYGDDTASDTDTAPPVFPGYVLIENFDTAIPSGWTLRDLGSVTSGVDTWTWQTPATSIYAFTGSSGGLLLSDADAGAEGSNQDETLISPPLDLRGYWTCTVRFQFVFKPWESDFLWVGATTDGNVNGTDGAVILGGQHGAPGSVVLTQTVGTNPVYITFRFVSTWGYYAALDGVNVYCEGRASTRPRLHPR